jgi:hypothetical protein
MTRTITVEQDAATDFAKAEEIVAKYKGIRIEPIIIQNSDGFEAEIDSCDYEACKAELEFNGYYVV